MKVIRGILSLALGVRILGELPKVGDVYVLDRMGNDPFDQDGRAHATVLEVKSGWVKYRTGHGHLGPDTASIRTFLVIFTKKKDLPVSMDV